MVGGRIAKRYAKALLEIGEAQNVLPALTRDLERFCELFVADAEFRGFLTNPSIEGKHRDQVLVVALTKLGGVHPLSRNFFRLLLRNQRIAHVDAVRAEFVERQDERAGRVRASVVTAEPLDALMRSKLQKVLEKLFEKRVVMVPTVDKEILGGVVTRVGHRVFDGSLKAQFERLRSRLV